MESRTFTVSLAIAAALSAATPAAGQHDTHQAGTGTAPSAAQVAECRQAQPVVSGLLDAALKRLDDARLTNSPAAMRDAADDLQAALVDMRSQLTPCRTMQTAPAEPHAADSMPTAPASPAGRPGTPAAPERAPVASPGNAAPHVGHATPEASRRPSSRAPAAAPPPTRPSAAGTAGTATHDTHAGDSTPAPSLAPAVPTSPRSAMPLSTGRRPVTSLAQLKCERTVDPKTASRMLYQGRMYYFCSTEERAEFAKAPERFVTAVAPEPAPAHAH